VIKLKDIVNEISDEEYGRSWLSTGGEFIPTNDETGHIISHTSKALDIIPPNELNRNIEPLNYLFKKGWQRITTGKLGQFYVGRVLFCSNPFTPPNEKQKSQLIQLAKKFGMNQVIYDNEKLRGNAHHVIWDKSDALEEVIDDENARKEAYSWQKPDGTFIPIKYSHGSDVHRMRKLNPDFDNKDDHTLDMWKMGWNRITFIAHTLYVHNEVRRPSDKQKSALIDLAIRAGLREVSYEGLEGVNNVILWSKDDVLEN
jgi:hypothetical protein